MCTSKMPQECQNFKAAADLSIVLLPEQVVLHSSINQHRDRLGQAIKICPVEDNKSRRNDNPHNKAASQN